MKTGENLEKMFTRITRMAFKNITSRLRIPPRPRMSPRQRMVSKPGIILTSYKKLPKSSKKSKSNKDFDLLGFILFMAMMSLTTTGNVPIVLIGSIIIILLYLILKILMR